MPLTVEVADHVGHDWAETVGAPIFYTRAFLSAYDRHPLQPGRLSYVLLRDGETTVAAVPCQRHSRPDPLGTLASILPDGAEGGALLTHVLHCYDTRIVAPDVTDGIVEATCDALSDLAGGPWGFVNVAEPLARSLRGTSLTEVPMPERYRMRIADVTFEDYFASLRSAHRRAIESGVRVEIHDGSSAHIEALAGLLADLAGRHDAAAYYPPNIVPFVRALGRVANVVEVWSAETLLAGGVNLVHGDTYHLWAAGARYGVTSFSPYYVLVLEVLRRAFAVGASVIEGGRGNGQFKRRYGFEPVPLSAFLGAR